LHILILGNISALPDLKPLSGFTIRFDAVKFRIAVIIGNLSEKIQRWLDMEDNQTTDSRETEHERNGRDERGRLGFLELLGRLKPPQFLAAVMILSTFLGGAFGYGYKFGIQNAGSKATKAEATVAPSKNENPRLPDLPTEEQFLGLYLRYFIAKDTYAKHESKENRVLLESARSSLAFFIQKQVSPEEKVLEESRPARLVSAETSENGAMVIFDHNGSVWPLDPDLGFASKCR